MPNFNFETMENVQKEKLRAFGKAVKLRAKHNNKVTNDSVIVSRDKIIAQALIMDKALAVDSGNTLNNFYIQMSAEKMMFIEEQASAKMIRKTMHKLGKLQNA